MFFKDVIGQEETKQRLIQEVNEGRIPHAQLICGPEGVGKLPLALAYARYISCTNRGATDACGVCPSCVKFSKLVHPDVHFVFPVVKSGRSDDYIVEWRLCGLLRCLIFCFFLQQLLSSCILTHV